MQINFLPHNWTDSLKVGIAWTVYFFVNVIFCIKYNPFEAIHPLLIVISYPLIVFGIYKITVLIRVQQQNYFFLILGFAIVILALFLWHYIDRWSVDVDRWSALAFWSESLLNGQYNFGSHTHLGGYASPLPVWQLFHFPFYLLGDTAYGQLFCLLIFFVFLFCWRTRLNIGGITLLLALSPGFWWEIAVRSDLLFNMLLLFVFLTAQFYYSAFWDKHKILTGAIVGLFICTKLFVVIPLFLFFFPRFLKYNMKEKIGFAITVIVCFSIPFIPFLFNENSILSNEKYNPFILQLCQGNDWQSCQMNILLLAIGSILLVIFAFMWKQIRELYFMTGLFLFALILAVGIYWGTQIGWSSVVLGDKFDKSYFNICIPFFLFFIHEIKIRAFDYSNYLINS